MAKQRRKAHRRQNELPSGRYRVQVVYKGEDGKRHTKSFTADTRGEAEDMADEFRRGQRATGGPVCEVVKAYLNAREGVLSPSTLRAYKSIKRAHFNGAFARRTLKTLSSEEVQAWISRVSASVQPKTARNVFGLFMAAADMASPGIRFSVQLPQKKRPELYCPSDADIKKLLAHIGKQENGQELKVAVMLAAFCTLRRGEICALLRQDVSPDAVSVTKCRVMTPDMVWITKQPKTFASYRTVPLPAFLYAEIEALDREPEERLIPCSPDALSNRFTRAVKSAGLPHIRFHDLRHYSASILHAIGVPDQYILARGGWSSDYVMKAVYRNSISEEARKQDARIAAHFATMQPAVQPVAENGCSPGEKDFPAGETEE